MINPEKLKNAFLPGDLVGCWGEEGESESVYVYIKDDSEDSWVAVLLGPTGFIRVRYVHIEAL